MELKKINILNYKSIKDVTLEINCYGNSNTQILVGINESGKSSILEAINLINGDLEEIVANDGGTYIVSCNEEYSYSVSKTGYVTQSGTINTDKNKTITVTLVADEGWR